MCWICLFLRQGKEATADRGGAAQSVWPGRAGL